MKTHSTWKLYAFGSLLLTHPCKGIKREKKALANENPSPVKAWCFRFLSCKLCPKAKLPNPNHLKQTGWKQKKKHLSPWQVGLFFVKTNGQHFLLLLFFLNHSPFSYNNHPQLSANSLSFFNWKWPNKNCSTFLPFLQTRSANLALFPSPIFFQPLNLFLHGFYSQLGRDPHVTSQQMGVAIGRAMLK